MAPLNFTPRRVLPSSQNHTLMTTNTPTSVINSRDPIDVLQQEDEDVLPRHIQIELQRNRRRIIDLEEQMKELKRLSIRKKSFEMAFSRNIFPAPSSLFSNAEQC